MSRSLTEGLDMLKPQGDGMAKPPIKPFDFAGRDTQDIVNAAVSAERASCAAFVRNYPRKLGEQQDTPFECVVVPPPDLNEIADAILARGE